MHNVLYRKYRARNFAEIHGQDQAVSILQTAISSGKHSHAYLFSGPRGTGKTSMARLVAKALSCSKFSELGDVCNECEACLAIEKGTFVDLIEIDAASNRGIEDIRQIKENINFLPVSSGFKVYIIDEVHMLTREAFNALLKTLEEPPAHVIFILATTEVHKLPMTILSRVQRFDFKFATLSELTAKLSQILKAEGVEMPEEKVFQLIYEFSGGSFRDAESILGKVLATLGGEGKALTEEVLLASLGLPDTKLAVQFCAHLFAGEYRSALELANELAASGVSLAQFINQSVHLIRKSIREDVLANSDYSKKLLALNILVSVLTEVRNIDDVSLLLEMALFKAIQPASPLAQKSVVTHQVPATKQVKQQVPTGNFEQTLPRSANKAEESQEVNGVDWPSVVNKVKKHSFKVWTMLRNSSANVEADQIVVMIGNGGIELNQNLYQEVEEVIVRALGDLSLSGLTVVVQAKLSAASEQPGDPEPQVEQQPASILDTNEDMVEEVFAEEE